MKIERHKTAIVRRRLSKPVQLLLDDNLLKEEFSFFDFGCGRGEDIQYLGKLKFSAGGFDPFYSESEIIPSSIVNLGYVLNVIEDPTERKEILEKAYSLANDLLVVSVMIRDKTVYPTEIEYNDGIITSWNTFQKYYTQKEFKDYIESVLGKQAHIAGLGVIYIFKNDSWIERYINSRVTNASSEIGLKIKEEQRKEILSKWMSAYQELGRAPIAREFPEYKHIIKFFGTREKAIEAIRMEVDQETFLENSKRRREKLIVSICKKIIKNNGAPKWKDLNYDEQTEVKLFYSSFQEVLDIAMQELKSLAELSVVSKYINRSTVGKILPDDIV